MNLKIHASNQSWIIYFLVAFAVILSCNFVYGATPEIFSVNPNWGRPDQDTDIVIKGSSFEPGLQVSLYGGGPFVKGSASTASPAWNVFISGNFAYVATSTGLEVFDISNPENATQVAGCSLPGAANDVFVSGNYAYIAAFTEGLQVVDIGGVISNPLPVVGSYVTTGTAYGVFVAGNYAYVADGNSGLQILDISDPTSPIWSGSYATPGTAYSLVVKENYAYVADYSEGLQIINVSNPEHPSFSGSCDKINPAENVYVDDEYAYVVGSEGFFLVDISNPANPKVINNVEISGYGGIHYSEKFAYMTTVSGLLIIDVNTTVNPSITGVYDVLESADAVYVSGSYTYAASSDSGFHIINIADPANPSFVGYCPIPNASVENIYVAGNYAYVADGINGLRIIDIINPAAPFIDNTYTIPGIVYDVHVAGNFAYVAAGSEGLQVVDISDPSVPQIVGSVKSQEQSNLFSSVHVAGDNAYVLDYWTRSLLKITIAQPTSPDITGSCILSNSGNDVYVAGNYAYVAADGGLEVIDITGPLLLVGSIVTPGYSLSVEVAGNYAYVATDYEGIKVVDISSATDPLLVGACNTPGYAVDVQVTDNNVYVADGVMGIQIIEPFTPLAHVNLIDSKTVSALVPAGYPTGGYDVYLVNPEGEMDILNNGYTASFTSPNPPTSKPSLVGPLLLLLFDD